jgi:uncharacterized protein VirK/YbjX
MLSTLDFSNLISGCSKSKIASKNSGSVTLALTGPLTRKTEGYCQLKIKNKMGYIIIY